MKYLEEGLQWNAYFLKNKTVSFWLKPMKAGKVPKGALFSICCFAASHPPEIKSRKKSLAKEIYSFLIVDQLSLL